MNRPLPSPPAAASSLSAHSRWESSTSQRAQLTFPSLRDGPLPLPPMGGEEK